MRFFGLSVFICVRFFVCECSVVGSRKNFFFRASIFATVSCSAWLVRSRRSSVSAKLVKTTVDSVR